MTGTVIITHNSGWACSNDAFVDIESDVIVDDGRPSIRQTKTLKANGLFNAEGNVINGFDVNCIMMTEDRQQHGMTGKVRQTGNLTIIDLTGEIKDTKSIIKNIK